MTDDELRRTAVLIERTDLDAIDRAADYLRACADALDAGPVAQVVAVTLEGAAGPSYMDLRFVSNRPSPDRQLLYPVAMPGARKGGNDASE